MTRTLRDIVKVETQALPVEAFSFLRELFVGDRKAINAFELATQVLSDFADDKLAKARGANESLLAAILEHYPKFLATLPTEDDGFYELRGDILEIDARFADYIERHFGNHGKELAGEIRKDEQTIKNASDSIPLREWSRKWREFSRSKTGEAISDAESRHIKRVRLDTVAKFGDLEIPEDPRIILRWLKDSQIKPFEDLQKEILPLVKEREAFTGPIEGLSQSLFSVWLGDKIYRQIASVTSLRSCQFASVIWLHIVRPEIEKEMEKERRALVRIASPTTMALSKRNVTLSTSSDLVAVEAGTGFQLSLDGAGAPSGSLAKFLTDEVFHTYVIMQMKYCEHGMPANGEFCLESGYGTILTAKGFTQRERQKFIGGRTKLVREHLAENIATAKKHIEDLGKIFVLRVGNYSTTAKRMPLIYDVTSNDGKRKERSLRHHPLVVEHFRSEMSASEETKKKRRPLNFVQVPRGLIEQPNASAVRYGYAFIQAVKDGSYHSVMSKEPITIKLRAAAELVGKENKGKISEKSFYSDIADHYIEAAGLGDLGHVEVDMTSEKLILRPEAHIIEPYIQKIPKPRNRKK